MAKLPKPPKSLPLTPPPYSKPTLPLPSRARRLRLSGEPSSLQSPLQPPGSTPKEAWQKVWSERPKISDIQRLPDEALKSAQHQAKLRRWRQWPLYGIGVVAFGMGMYGVMLWISLTRDVDIEALPSDLSDRFDNGAEWYDDKVNFSETLLLLTARRKKLTEMAKGHVLEVAVGTGRNVPYYDTKQCATVTLLDSSGPMLTVAKRKWNDTHKEYFNRVFSSSNQPWIPSFLPMALKTDTILLYRPWVFAQPRSLSNCCKTSKRQLMKMAKSCSLSTANLTMVGSTICWIRQHLLMQTNMAAGGIRTLARLLKKAG